MALGINGLWRRRMIYLLRLVACLFVLLSFNVKALVINGCTIEPAGSCSGNFSGVDFSNISFQGAMLYGIDLSNGNLSNSDFSNAWLENAILVGANLYNTNL